MYSLYSATLNYTRMYLYIILKCYMKNINWNINIFQNKILYIFSESKW